MTAVQNYLCNFFITLDVQKIRKIQNIAPYPNTYSFEILLQDKFLKFNTYDNENTPNNVFILQFKS